MSTVSGTCCIDGCPRPADRQTPHGPLCSTHRKRTQPSRAGGKALTAEVEERDLSFGEQLGKIAIEYADVEADVGFAKAEGDLAEIAKALAKSKLSLDRLKRAAERYGSTLVRKEHGEHIKRGLAAAQAAGVRLGRPPRLDFHAAAHAVKEAGSIRKAADALGVAEATVRRALQRKSITTVISTHGEMHALGGTTSPPEGGGSEES